MKIRNIWGETVRNIGLITQTNPKSPMAEAFRTLRTNIQFANIDEEIESMVITSGQPSEGKSTVAINLALTIGQGGKRVLLIDCDMRKPTIHKTFRISNLFGLTNILMGTKTLEEVLYSQEERLGSVYVLPSGSLPPNPAELLGSNRMKQFLQKAKEKFDMIVIDAPPVGLFTDGAILSTLVDGVIFVAAAGEADIETTQRAKERLDKVNANILGVVLNKVEMDSRAQSDYDHYGQASFHNKSAAKRKKRRRK